MSNTAAQWLICCFICSIILLYLNQRKRCKTTPETKTYFRGMAAKASVIGICVTLFPKEDEVYFCHFSVDILFCCLPHSIAETTKLFLEMYKLSPCTNKTVLVDSIVTKIKVFIVKKNCHLWVQIAPHGQMDYIIVYWECMNVVPQYLSYLMHCAMLCYLT